MQSKVATVAEYLAELLPDRRKVIEAVRKIIRANLDKDYEEGMQYGMIGYYVPHRIYPPGYHCDPKQPLPFAALASQKNYMSIYLMGLYADPEREKWFEAAWKKTGKKIDMGKCCIRFKKLEDVALDVVGQAIRQMPAKLHIKQYEAALLSHQVKKKSTAKKATPKPATKTKKTGAKKSTKRVR